MVLWKLLVPTLGGRLRTKLAPQLPLARLSGRASKGLEAR